MHTMKKHILLALFCATAVSLAQNAEKPAETGWKNSMVAGLNINQVRLENWNQGGENSLAWTLIGTGKFLYTEVNYNWTNNLKVMYGRTKLGSNDFEKTDDELFFESIYSHNLGWKVNPYAALTVKTQLAPGYKTIDSAQTQTSGFFDPGYLMQSAGFVYAPSESFSTRLGVAVKETFTSKFTRFGYADDPKTTEIEKSRVQTGIESGTAVKFTVMDNILFTSQLNLFSAFKTLDVWDVRWDNSLTAKVNTYINASLNVLLVHEIAQTRRTQLKEALALGITYTLF